MIESINTYLTILNNLIVTHYEYMGFYRYVQLVREKTGSTFNQYTEDGIPRAQTCLAGLAIPAVHPKKRGADAQVELNALKTVLKLTEDFSVLSGMDNDDWLTLARYIYDSKLRASVNNRRGEHSGTPLGKERVNMLLEQPWTLVILLLEVLVLAS
jgi:hypothetical protein